MQVKAIACELPSKWGLPFSRFSHDDIAQEAIRQEIVASISGTTVWRWLSAEAIKPWSFRSWIFPRDPLFLPKASSILDLYQGFWEGIPLGPADYVISADEKTSIQCRERLHPSLPSIPGQSRRVEFEYERGGAVSYLAAWDVRRAKLFGLCEDHTGIDPFHRLVDLVMQQEPYISAHRVFWITDNGSSHRGKPAIQRLSEWYPQARQIHTPVHASWLNQIEIYFSIVQRKVLTPNDFSSLADLQKQIMDFQQYYEIIAKPFQWKFTCDDLKRTLSRLSSENIQQEKVAA
jgi:DDE superfamily endonuclease